ncbi:MAG TPA: nucleoside hydrolase [Chryseosolibacter sp.]
MARLLFLIVFCVYRSVFAQAVPKIIFDTDIGPDYDDVGALAMLHALADKGECELLATVASNNHQNIAPVLSVINTYFRRPALPVGMVRGSSVALPAWQKWDSLIVRRYPHALTSNDQAEDAVKLYRKILAAQPDSSVTIVTVGFLTNMANLLKSKPDAVSPLGGAALVKNKVKRLVSMAGAFPSGKEFNIEKDALASQHAFGNWPTPVYFTGWEIGAKLFSGIPLISSTIKKSPVKDVFEISIPKSKEDSNGRKSWDQTAVLMAVRGVDQYYTLIPGRIVCEPDGRNSWNPKGRGQYYAVEKTPATEVEKIINDLMMHTPKSTR